MTEVSEQVYTGTFGRIFDWFHDNVHLGPEGFDYRIIELRDTYKRMVDIVSKRTHRLYFRVILKVTYEDLTGDFVPKRTMEDWSRFDTREESDINPLTTLQICYIQLDEMDDPISGILFAYSPYDERYHVFRLPDGEDGL